MKQFLTIIACILTLPNLQAQENCFTNCYANFEKSNLPVHERSQKILQGLVGCKAPDFTVRTLAGRTLKLSELKGKIVVINFWFINCAPCIAELPALNKLEGEYKSKDVVFIAFARDDNLAVLDFLRSKTFNYHMVSSEYDISKTYCILAGWPTNIVLDKNGIVKQIFSGGPIDERANTEAYDKMKPVIDESLLK